MRWYKDFTTNCLSSSHDQLTTGLLTRKGIFALPGPMRVGLSGTDRSYMIFLDIQQFKVIK
jgi:hypothetical protein